MRLTESLKCGSTAKYRGKRGVLAILLTVSTAVGVSAQSVRAFGEGGAPSPAVSRTEDGRSGKAAEKSGEAEMTRLVLAMEERIRQLEEKIAALTKSGGASQPSTTAAPAVAIPVQEPKSVEQKALERDVATLKDQVKQSNQFLTFLKDVEVSGIVDGYYSYNNNKVDMFTQGRAFDVRHNTFSLQMAKFSLNKTNSLDSPLGFRVDIGLGETVDRVISVADATQNQATKHVLQAYASYVAPIGKGLTIDFGKMYTPIGAEVVDTKDNFNYSRGWLFTYGPYYHMGFRAKYAINSKAAVTGFLFNGWDNVFENNVGSQAGKTVGVQLALSPTSRFALTETYLAGPEAPLANIPAVSKRDNMRHIADTVASYVVTDKLTLLGNFVVGSDGDNDGKRGSWTGGAAYFKYAFNSRAAFSPRFEIFRDPNGLRTGTAQTVRDLTLTQEVKLVNNLLTRFEFRRDFSNQKFFTNRDGKSLTSQNTFIIGISYAFSNRDQ